MDLHNILPFMLVAILTLLLLFCFPSSFPSINLNSLCIFRLLFLSLIFPAAIKFPSFFPSLCTSKIPQFSFWFLQFPCSFNSPQNPTYILSFSLFVKHLQPYSRLISHSSLFILVACIFFYLLIHYFVSERCISLFLNVFCFLCLTMRLLLCEKQRVKFSYVFDFDVPTTYLLVLYLLLTTMNSVSL